MSGELERLRADILARYASIYQFCRQHENLKRSTVYAVLAGRYAGDAKEQLARIRKALDGPGPQPVVLTRERLAEVLQQVKCRRCRPASRRKCQRCRVVTFEESRAMIDFLHYYQEETISPTLIMDIVRLTRDGWRPYSGRPRRLTSTSGSAALTCWPSAASRTGSSRATCTFAWAACVAADLSRPEGFPAQLPIRYPRASAAAYADAL